MHMIEGMPCPQREACMGLITEKARGVSRQLHICISLQSSTSQGIDQILRLPVQYTTAAVRKLIQSNSMRNAKYKLLNIKGRLKSQ